MNYRNTLGVRRSEKVHFKQNRESTKGECLEIEKFVLDVAKIVLLIQTNKTHVNNILKDQLNIFQIPG